MKNIFLITIILLLEIFCQAQTSDDLKLAIDSLEKHKEDLNKQVIEIDKQISLLSARRNEVIVNQQIGKVYVLKRNESLVYREKLGTIPIQKGTKVIYLGERTERSCFVSYNGNEFIVSKLSLMPLEEDHIYKNINTVSDSIEIIQAKPYVFSKEGELYKNSKDFVSCKDVPAGTIVLFVKEILSTGYSNCKILYNDSIYFTHKSFLITKEENDIKIAKAKLAKQKEVDYKKSLIVKYGQKDATRILEKKIWIGMTKDMLKLSWGSPDDINRTVTSYTVHEQWVYGDVYVYVEDGIVTSWQD